MFIYSYVLRAVGGSENLPKSGGIDRTGTVNKEFSTAENWENFIKKSWDSEYVFVAQCAVWDTSQDLLATYFLMVLSNYFDGPIKTVF